MKSLTLSEKMESIQKVLTWIFISYIVYLFMFLNNVQPNYFIDEVFHVPQTLQYCAGNFTQVCFNCL